MTETQNTALRRILAAAQEIERRQTDPQDAAWEIQRMAIACYQNEELNPWPWLECNPSDMPDA